MITKDLTKLNSVMMLSNFKDVRNFKETIFNIFDKHVPIKQKYLRANEALFMTKELHREIMKISRIRNNFLRTKSQ